MKLHHRLLFIAIVAFTSFTTAKAEDGTTAYNFLNTTPSSHIYALGGQNISLVDDDINLVNQNPALLGPEVGYQLGLNYMRYIGSSNFMGLTFGAKTNEHSALAFGLQYFGYGDLKAADPDGTITGNFSPKDISFNLMYSHDITERWRGGINVKMVYSNYEEYTAWALATDLGINYYDPDKDLSFSLLFKNLGGQIKKFNDKNDPLPWDIQLGYTQSLTNVPIRISITATNLNKWKLPYYDRVDKNSTTSELEQKSSFGSNFFRHLVFGVEYVPTDKFYIALGYNYKVRTDMATYSRNFLSGFSIGTGMKMKAFGFGIALAQPHAGGTTFMVNLSTSISDLLNN